MLSPDQKGSPKELFQAVVRKESKRLEEYLLWLEHHMPASFFQEIDQEQFWHITLNLMSLETQEFFSQIHLKKCAIVLCLDSPDADLKILKKYRMRGIKNYRTFISNVPPPFTHIHTNLRVAVLIFTGYEEVKKSAKDTLSKDLIEATLSTLKARNLTIRTEEFYSLLEAMGHRFLHSMTKERLAMAVDVFFRAKNKDSCQYEVRSNEDWKAKKDIPSLQLVIAWRNVAKHDFLYRLAKIVYRHNLRMTRVNATYIEPYTANSVLILSIGLHGQEETKAAWESTDIEEFIKEVLTFKYFDGMEEIEKTFVDSKLVSGTQGSLIKSIAYFVHQMLLQEDLNLYSLSHIEEALCRHPELTQLIIDAFEKRFHPKKRDTVLFEKIKTTFYDLVNKLDTAHEMNDKRRRSVLKQAMAFVEYTVKTNFYAYHKTAFSFRLNPTLLDLLPYDRKEKFAEIPFGIFFMKGQNFLAFHIRFKDLSRGGLRTVIPRNADLVPLERNNVFSECYGLAYTQQKKNKDIPEGGAKGIIFTEFYDYLKLELGIFRQELEEADLNEETMQERLKTFEQEQRLALLYQSQRSYIESFLSIINCDDKGNLKEDNIVDYWQKPEYIYLGPDENMHNEMIIWIAAYSQSKGYKPGSCFISSKPGAGINHKEYGVTSYGVNQCMEEVLLYLKINPKTDLFTIKMTGGPDGDVAGNQILNLYRFYPKTAKLLAITDVSGTAYDPEGLDLNEMTKLFYESKPLRYYPVEKLSEGGFLLDLRTKKEESSYKQTTLLWKKSKGKLTQEWLPGSEMNHLYRFNVHQIKTDVFIPGGGRPRTLNDTNYSDFLDKDGQPTAKAIIEGANLYLTPWARHNLEKEGVLIIKDSSANKGGVICSSYEVLSGLVLAEEEFLEHKETLAKEFLEIIKERAKEEASLLLATHKETHIPLTELSEKVSERINAFKYQILDTLLPIKLSSDPKDHLVQCLLQYSPKFLRENYPDRILKLIPDIHKKAIIACFLGSQIVYKKGLSWNPSIAEILPLLVQDVNWLVS